jgi:predicted TIM-barrel fold metal-dependent hydrolase
MNSTTVSAIRIIDCHGHYGLFNRVKIIPADAQAMVRAMDKAGVEKLCISSFLSVGPDCKAGNKMVAEAVKKYPHRFVGYGVVNPNRPQEIDGELRRCFDEYGMKAIKLHPAGHQYPISGSSYKKAFEFAAKRHLPILSHEWGGADVLESLSADYPGISFIIAHVGFWDGRSDFAYADVVGGRDNVYVDLAYSNLFYNAVERLVALVGPKKIVFGSDFPLHDLAYQLGRMFFAKLPDEEKRMILGLNMLRIIGDS